MKFFYRFLTCFVLLLSHVLADEVGKNPLESFPELAFQFETTVHSSSGDRPDSKIAWRLWRAEHEVEVYQLGTKDGEIWMLDGAGGVMLSRVLHPERSEILFNAMELRILNRPADWVRCCTLVSSGVLGTTLKPTGTQIYRGEKVTVYSGDFGSEKWTVLWNESDKVAVSIRVETDGRVSTTNLVERHELKSQPWDRLSARGYERIGYTELGDNDTDPKMKRIMNRMGIQCSHKGCGPVCFTPQP